jgi:hypothetical protein
MWDAMVLLFQHYRMHVFTHLKKESQGKTGLGLYPDGMVETDGHVGELLKLIDDLGAADNTIVVYTTDNGAEVMTFPDGGATPFKGEKATNWEGGFRVPCLIRWPGVIKPGTIVNDMCAHEDFIPTFAAAAGETELAEKLKKGHKLNGKNFTVHLDGENLLPFFKGDETKSPREGFLYWSDDGDLMALRVRNWKISFMEQNTEISPESPSGPWSGQFNKMRLPKLYNLRADPFERGPTSPGYFDWQAHRMFLFVPAQAIVARWLESFQGVSAASQSGELHRQRRDGKDHDGKSEQELMTVHRPAAMPVGARLRDQENAEIVAANSTRRSIDEYRRQTSNAVPAGSRSTGWSKEAYLKARADTQAAKATQAIPAPTQ